MRVTLAILQIIVGACIIALMVDHAINGRWGAAIVGAIILAGLAGWAVLSWKQEQD